MSNLTRRDIYQQAIDEWGFDSQVDMLIEEAAELIVAVNHARRACWAAPLRDQVIEELADVEIMLEQMRMAFGPDEVDRVKLRKVLRLKERLQKKCP
jgi:NTP pyrophosphatase (non-canonical NTP hydrolase)